MPRRAFVVLIIIALGLLVIVLLPEPQGPEPSLERYESLDSGQGRTK